MTAKEARALMKKPSQETIDRVFSEIKVCAERDDDYAYVYYVPDYGHRILIDMLIENGFKVSCTWDRNPPDSTYTFYISWE